MADLKVAKGDPIRSTDWNRIVDAISGDEIGNPALVSSMSRVLVDVLNSSGRDYDIGEVFYPSSYSGPTGGEVYDIPGAIEIVCTEPTWHTSIAGALIAAEPIPDGERGKAVGMGLCVVKVANTDTDLFVMVDPTNEYNGRVSTGGFASVLKRIDDDYVVAMVGREQNLWRYKLDEASQAPSDTDAKLYDLDGTEISSAIDLKDPLSIGDGDAINYEGYCIQTGNEFHISAGPC